MNQDARAVFDSVGQELAPSFATVSRMFGMPCLKIGKKSFAGLANDEMIFKLHGDDHAEALSLAGAHLFDPMGSGRPMREWIAVPLTHADRWPELSHKALSYVAEG